MSPYYPQYLRADPVTCRGQFILTLRDTLVPSGWVTRSHAGWTLGFSRPLTCTTVRDGTAFRGWLLGHAVDESGRMLGEDREVQLPAGGADRFREWVDHLTGRFIAVDFDKGGPLVYQDVYGMLAAVFAPEEQVLASTGLLIPVTARTPYATDRILAADIPYRSAMYPLGLTPRHGVERMLPNHVLDLARGHLRRVWPLNPFAHDGDPATIAARTAEVVTRAMRAVRRVLPLQIPLTAGLDSRLLLACARELLDGTVFFTADLGDEGGWQDISAASQLARRFGLVHRVFPARHAWPRDRRAWAVRTGGETGERRGWHSCRTLGMQEGGRASMTGFVGELARAYWWARFTPDTVVTPDSILARCAVPRRPEFVQRAESWLAGLPPLDAVGVIEVLYLEQRGACWAGVVEYGELGASDARMAPLCQAALVRDLLRLPLEYRRRTGVHLDIIRARWPELLELPFGDGFVAPASRRRYFAMRLALQRRLDRLGRMARVARIDPRRVLRRLRP